MVTIESLKAVVMKIDPNGTITRGNVTDVLDMNILIERYGYDTREREAIDHGRKVLRKFGEQIWDSTHSMQKMQDVFYSFSNSFKYCLSAVTIYIVRNELTTSWGGIGDWME